MSYDTHESLEMIVSTLKSNLPALKKMLATKGSDASALHITVEMVSSLVARYERGEILEKK